MAQQQPSASRCQRSRSFSQPSLETSLRAADSVWSHSRYSYRCAPWVGVHALVSVEPPSARERAVLSE